MGLHGKLVAAVEFKSGADVFHELLRQKPQQLCEDNPFVQSWDLIDGEFGRVGTVMFITYTHGTYAIYYLPIKLFIYTFIQFNFVRCRWETEESKRSDRIH